METRENFGFLFYDKVTKTKRKTPTMFPPSSAPPPPWIELPKDITANILHRLGTIEVLATANRVCTTWWKVIKDPSFWRVIDMKNDGEEEMAYHYDKMCRYAVDLSQGQLMEINVEYFGTDELLQYIANRSSQLKRLTLACCSEISSPGLREIVPKFSKLEELHLFFISTTLATDVEAIGLSCPMLKSFTFNERGYKNPVIKGDEYAMVIAKTMPGLRHLRLFGNKLTNNGLQAILDGCPHLVTLDMRQCFNIVLEGDLGKRCSQLKELRRPSDHTDDYEWDTTVFDIQCNDRSSESDSDSDSCPFCDHDGCADALAAAFFMNYHTL